MVVIDKLLESPSDMVFAQGHHPIEALVLDRPHEPLRAADGPAIGTNCSEKLVTLTFVSWNQTTEWMFTREDRP